MLKENRSGTQETTKTIRHFFGFVVNEDEIVVWKNLTIYYIVDLEEHYHPKLFSKATQFEILYAAMQPYHCLCFINCTKFYT